MCAVKQQPQEQPQKSHKHILQKHLQIDQSIFVSYGMHAYNKLFCIFGDFYVSGMQDAEVTKSL